MARAQDKRLYRGVFREQCGKDFPFDLVNGIIATSNTLILPKRSFEKDQGFQNDQKWDIFDQKGKNGYINELLWGLMP